MRRLLFALLALVALADRSEAQVITGNTAGPCATANSLAIFTASTTLGCASVTDNGTGALTGPAASNLALYAATGTNLLLGGNASTQLTLNGTNVTLASDTGYFALGALGDVRFYRDAANIFALRNGTSAQTFNLYNTYTDAANYERLALTYVGNVAKLIHSAAGTGVASRILRLNTVSTDYFGINDAGSIWNIATSGNLIAGTDNVYDIGLNGFNRPRTGYFGTSVVTPIVISSAGSGTGTYSALGAVNVQTSAAGVGNAADATDDTLFTYSLPLNSLSANGKSVRVRAWGKTAANVNNKTIKLWFAGATTVTSGAIGISNLDWSCEMEITRIDATHVSVVSTYEDGGFANGVTTVTPNLLVADLTTNASVIKVTGASATSAANDVLGHGMKAWFEN